MNETVDESHLCESIIDHATNFARVDLCSSQPLSVVDLHMPCVVSTATAMHVKAHLLDREVAHSTIIKAMPRMLGDVSTASNT